MKDGDGSNELTHLRLGHSKRSLRFPYQPHFEIT